MQFNAGEGGGMSNDEKYLEMTYGRLIYVHNGSPNVDYMLRFRGIIDGRGAALAAAASGDGRMDSPAAQAVLDAFWKQPGDRSAIAAALRALVTELGTRTRGGAIILSGDAVLDLATELEGTNG